jgi:GH24 family phage-related lysozyme (muramidase)
MTPSSPRQLTEQEFRCLERFAVFEISLDQLRSCLRHVMRFDFNAAEHEGKRWMENDFIAPEPGVLITKQHIEDALTKKRDGRITEG